MSNFYDPWSHTIYLFLIRMLQCIVLSLVLGLSVWYALLHLHYKVKFVETTWLVLTTDNDSLRVMLALCLGNGVLLTGWLFTFLMMRGPRASEHHHRGARIITRNDE